MSETVLIEKEELSPSGMTTKVIKGSFWVLIGQILPLIATFVASPFVIRQLGSESYGVLILLGLISTYFSFADFGMGLASTKFASQAYAATDREKEGIIIRTATIVAICSSLVIAIPLFFFSGWVVRDLLNVPLHLQKQASIGLKITSVAFFCSIIGGVLNSPQLSRMRLDLNVLINTSTKILMILSTPIVLYLGGGIVEATIVAFCAAVIIMTSNIIVSGRLLPQLYKKTISKDVARQLIKFGGNVVLYSIGLMLINNLEKLVLTRLVSVKSLAYYSVASTFANMTSMFSMAMVQALIPAFSQLLSPEKKAELASLFLRTVKISLLGLIPSVMILLVIAKPFFTLWAGPEFGNESIYPFYILIVGIFFGILVYVPNCVLIASGRSDVFAKFYLVEIIPYTILTFFLVKYLGILGAAAALAIKETVNSIVFMWYTKKYTGLSYDFIGQIKNLVFGFLVFLPAVVLAFFYNSFSLWMIGVLPLCFAGYLIVVWKRFVNEEEKKWIISKLNRIKKK